MVYSISLPAATLQALKDPRLRHIHVLVSHGGGSVELVPQTVSCDAAADYQKWSFSLKNYGEYEEGLFGDCAASVLFSHDGSTWTQVFGGYVSAEGMRRVQGRLTDDHVTLELVDRTSTKGMRRRTGNAVLAGMTICDPADPDSSILHRLGALMGVDSFDTAPIPHVKDIVVLGDSTAWRELQALRDAYAADMCFDSQGRLRFRSFQDTQWTEPESEWTFIADPSREETDGASRVLGRISTVRKEVECNKAVSSVEVYEHRSLREIFRSTENWNADLEECAITIPAGAFWPEEGVASLAYRDPTTGEEYPYATGVLIPTVGGDKSYDICHTGGSVQVVSFNGSTGQTVQEPGASQIVLRNTGSSEATIIRLVVRGEPFLLARTVSVEERDAEVVDEVDIVEKTIDGRYATSAERIGITLARMVGRGKGRPRRFRLSTIFLPQVQRGMGCTLVTDTGDEVACTLVSYDHRMGGSTLATMRTSVVLDETASFTPVYDQTVTISPSSALIPRRGEAGPQGEQGEAYVVVVESSNGDVFKPGEDMHTILTGRVFLNGEEVTPTIPDSAFRWRRKSFFEPNDDALWNSNHMAGYRTIDVTADSVNARATYFCDIIL